MGKAMRTFVIYGLCLLFSCMAQAERGKGEDALIIDTPRVVFSGDDSWRSVHIRNIAENTGYYEVYAEPARFLSFNPASSVDVPANLLEQLVDVSTQQVKIRSDEEQILEVLIARPEGLPDGEYHSRLVFRQLPSPADVADREQKEAQLLAALDDAVPADQIHDDGTVQVRVKPEIYGVPVLIRQGAVSVRARLSEPDFYEDERGFWLTVKLSRAGNRSLFGDFKVLGMDATRPTPDVLMIKKYVSLDMPQTERTAAIRFPDEIDLVGYHAIKVVFQERSKFGGREYAELVISLDE